MNKLFEVLTKSRNNRYLNKSNEVYFYHKYRSILYDNKIFSKYGTINSYFDILRANIIIRGILNKNTIEKIIEEEVLNKEFNTREMIIININRRMSNIPYMNYKNQKIYIPFFNLATNQVYSKDFFMLYEIPYSSLRKDYDSFIFDPFDVYKQELYESPFSKLIKIYRSNSSSAYYNFDLRTVFIINDQGYVDSIIHLFDRYMKKPTFNNIIERLKPAIESYYQNDLARFVYCLYENKLISKKVYKKICKIKQI